MKEAQRPWPAPERPWTVTMEWRELLFAHWPMAPEVLRPLLPPGITLDTRDGEAWVGIVPFRMTGIRARWVPPVGGTGAFPELNVRTYVRVGDRPGVWFFSLDAGSRLAVAAARWCFHLPYYRARMVVGRHGGTVEYASERVHRGAPRAVLRARYRAVGPQAGRPAPGSLAHWLVERYCLFTRHRDGRVLIGEIDHPPWRLRAGEWEVEEQAMLGGLGLRLPGTEPILHVAEPHATRAWSVRPAVG